MADANLSLETGLDWDPCLGQLPEGPLGQHHAWSWGAWDLQCPPLRSQDEGLAEVLGLQRDLWGTEVL